MTRDRFSVLCFSEAHCVTRCPLRFPAASMVVVAIIALIFGSGETLGFVPPSAPATSMSIVVVKTSELGDPVLVNNFLKHLEIAGYEARAVDVRPEPTNEVTNFVVEGSFMRAESGFELRVYSHPPSPVFRPATIDVSDGSEQAIRRAVIQVRRFLESEAVQIEIIQSRYANALKALEKDPHDFESLVTIGLDRYFRRDWEGAIETLTVAADFAPRGDPSAIYSLARCYSELANPDKTRLHLEATLAIDPSHEGARLELGNLHLTQHDFENGNKKINGSQI